jgi:hypothetical protein
MDGILAHSMQIDLLLPNDRKLHDVLHRHWSERQWFLSCCRFTSIIWNPMVPVAAVARIAGLIESSALNFTGSASSPLFAETPF